jgi:peptidylprolyl isomerase
MEHLAALHRGTEALGFYKNAAARTGIVSARMLDELPAEQRPAVEVLRTESGAYAVWLEARRNRKDDWYLHGAGHIDLCNALPPVRTR